MLPLSFSFSPLGKKRSGVYTDAISHVAMENEPTGLRIVELHLVPDANGWVRLPPDLLQALEIQPGDMLSFYADESGFRVKGSKKPPYFHASTETPPSSPPVTPTPLQREPVPSPAL